MDFEERVASVDIIDSGNMSDHFLVKAIIGVRPTLQRNDEAKKLSYRDFNKISIEDFKEDILQSDLGNWSAWCSADLDDSVNLYNRVLNELMS